MAGRTPAEAVRNYVGPLSRAVSCVTRARLNVSPRGYDAAANPHQLVLGSGVPERLSASFSLTLLQRYVIVEAEGARGPWKCSTTGYLYTLYDGDQREIVAYHWHPEGDSEILRPHAHLGAGAGLATDLFSRTHLPTNRVSVEDFLWFCIRDLGVPTRRSDWEEKLAASRDLFEDWQTWPRPGRPN